MAFERRSIAIDLPGRRRRASLSLVPLIDMALILVFLFVLVTEFGQHHPPGIAVSSELFDALSEPADEQAKGVAPLTVTLSADGMLSLWDRRRIALGELPGVLQERVGSIVLSGADTPPVVISPEPDVPLQMLIDAVGVAQSNSFFKTHIAATKLAAEGAGK